MIIVSMFLLGAGFGPSMTAFLVAVQAAVPWEVRGVATSTMQLCRSLGGTVGVTLLGALLTSRLLDVLPEGGADASALLSATARAGLGPEQLAALQTSLADGLHVIFLVLLGLSAIGLAVVAIFARGTSAAEAAPAGSAADR
jgi:fucose permease